MSGRIEMIDAIIRGRGRMQPPRGDPVTTVVFALVSLLDQLLALLPLSRRA